MVDRQGKLRVAVLMGGISAERNVSLSTGRQILASLDRDKYEVIGVDAALLPGSTRSHLQGADQEVRAVAEARDALGNALVSVEQIAVSDSAMRPDVVFIALHGKFGEDGTVQGMLDLLGLPYTGSGVLASALAMDKSMAKKVLAADGIPVAPSLDFVCPVTNHRSQIPNLESQVSDLGFPLMVKPSRQGSTIGMTKVNGPDELNDAIRQAAIHDDRIVIERFIEGVELTVGVLGNNEPLALPVVEIVPAKGFYDYEAKYTPGATEEIVPARISAEATARAQEIALAAHKSLDCRGMSRVDMIHTPDGGFYVLEVNTIPGMTPTSLLPRAAEAAGIQFVRLLDMIIGYALEESERR